MATSPESDRGRNGGHGDTKFDLPVDSEHKALRIKIASFAKPHMRAFHLCWFGFFTSFVSTFAPAAMLPVIRDSIGVDGTHIGNAGIAAVSGTIIARVAMGSICDWIGPRLGMSSVLLTSSAFVFSLALANGPISFALLRFGIGFGLSAFVACQFWTASMFNVKIVGVANATTGGWGNLGGGLTQILMPVAFRAMSAMHEPNVAWRFAMFIPGFMHILGGILILFFSTDLPDGNYALLKQTGAMTKENPITVMTNALTNYRMWCLAIVYGFCFGIELTMNNIIVSYLFDQFGVNLTVAGILGSLFGLMNICARSIGGAGSDMMGRRFGMRGRLWALWTLQTGEGTLCIFMGLAKGSLGATIVLMVMFSLLVQSSEGATYGVVPFVSKRSLGVVSGFVGAGGNAGSVITQALFFQSSRYEVYEGLIFMGIMVLCMTLFVVPIYFPMWGGMLFGPKEGVTEEDYYLGEYTDVERAAGLANAAIKFAQESKSQRAPMRRDLSPVKESESFCTDGSVAPHHLEQPKKIEAATAETVRKLEMGMHDVGTQVCMDPLDEDLVQSDPLEHSNYSTESEYIMMTPKSARSPHPHHPGRMDHVGVIPEGDEERVSNSQGDTQDYIDPQDDYMDDFSMPPPPMHPMHPASAPYEPQSPSPAPPPAPPSAPVPAAAMPQDGVRGPLQNVDCGEGGGGSSGGIGRGGRGRGRGGGGSHRRAPSPTGRGARAQRAPPSRGYVSGQHMMPQGMPPDGSYYVYDMPPSTPSAVQHTAQASKLGEPSAGNWSGIPYRQPAPPLYHPHPHLHSSHPDARAADPRYVRYTARGEATPSHYRAEGDARGRAVR